LRHAEKVIAETAFTYISLTRHKFSRKANAAAHPSAEAGEKHTAEVAHASHRGLDPAGQLTRRRVRV
jgi:hypothetical protein